MDAGHIIFIAAFISDALDAAAESEDLETAKRHVGQAKTYLEQLRSAAVAEVPMDQAIDQA